MRVFRLHFRVFRVLFPDRQTGLLRLQKEIIYIAGKDPVLQRGGHSSYVRAHARAALRLGYEPHIFCISTDPGIQSLEFGTLHKIASLPLSARSSTVPFHSRYLVRGILAHIGNRPGPHILHGFGLWGYAGVRVREKLAARGTQASVVNSAYTTFDYEFRAKFEGAKASNRIGDIADAWVQYIWALAGLTACERPLIQGSQLIAANYESVRRLVEARYGNEVPFSLLPYCSEEEFLRRQADAGVLPKELERFEDSGSPLIVAVSRHDPRKGIGTLLRALARLRRDNIGFRACLLGGGELIETHRHLVLDLGISDCVLLTGWVPDPFAFLAHADIFALPSIQEGSGSVSLLEALQAARPAVVASRIDGIVEDVADGESALLVEPGDEMALAAALRTLIEDAALRKRLALGGHKIYRERFSAEAMTLALGNLYTNFGLPPPAQLNARDHSSPSADKRK